MPFVTSPSPNGSQQDHRASGLNPSPSDSTQRASGLGRPSPLGPCRNLARKQRDCGRWGGAGKELLGATLYGTAGHRPNRGCGPRAAAEATWHNVTKPHRKRTYRDAGRERASGAAGQSMRQAGASTSRRHWPWTRMELRRDLKWTGGEVRYLSSHADVWRAEQPSVCMQPQITDVNHQL